MSQVETPRALLITALQDLHDAETAMTERLPALTQPVRDPELAGILARDAQGSVAQRETLTSILGSLDAGPGGAPNIWLRAILDDAARDTRTEAPGPLLDIALAGALRKGKQAERVSYETAIALARRLQLAAPEKRLAAIRDAEQATDDALAGALLRLAAKA